MKHTESLHDYYTFTNKEVPKDLLCRGKVMSHFNVLKRSNCSVTLPFVRRDYYKICLLDDEALLQTANQKIRIDRPSIFFSNPEIDYGWQTVSEKQKGYICLFNDGYLSNELKSALRKLNSLFKVGSYPFLFLQREEFDLFCLYFERLQDEYNSSFEYKKEVIQNLLQLIIYLGIKIQRRHVPAVKEIASTDRVVNQFMQLLERQFPVDSPQNPIQLKTPADFAVQLHVHVNHLNHCLKAQLGKSTTQLINERIIAEAIDLLQHSDWNISQIAESLGFDYLQHFTYFFKKHVAATPTTYRNRQPANI